MEMLMREWKHLNSIFSVVGNQTRKTRKLFTSRAAKNCGIFEWNQSLTM